MAFESHPRFPSIANKFGDITGKCYEFMLCLKSADDFITSQKWKLSFIITSRIMAIVPFLYNICLVLLPSIKRSTKWVFKMNLWWVFGQNEVHGVCHFAAEILGVSSHEISAMISPSALDIFGRVIANGIGCLKSNYTYQPDKRYRPIVYWFSNTCRPTAECCDGDLTMTTETALSFVEKTHASPRGACCTNYRGM